MSNTYFHHKRILIIGGTGSLGHTLADHFLKCDCQITILSRDENKQWEMKNAYPSLNFILCDIRQYDLLEKCLLCNPADIIILAAALKHIDICESNIDQCICTNITGCKNVIDICSKCKIVDTLLYVSTDKACMPINVYGMCKATIEKCMINASVKHLHTRFLCVRYGNVINSRGSLIPKFITIGQDNAQTNFAVTHVDMTRFFMTLTDSVRLIFNCLINGVTGDIFIPIIPAFKIMDIATLFGQHFHKPVHIVGIRQGEKLHECLINNFEFCYVNKKICADQALYVLNYTHTYASRDNFCYTSEDTGNINALINTLQPYISFPQQNSILKTVVVLGSQGMLGGYIAKYMADCNLVLLSRREFDVETDQLSKLDTLIPKNCTIVNCVGAIKQRTHVAPAAMYFVNGVFPNLLAAYCHSHNHKLIHISTDCVYDGKTGYYNETAAKTATDVYGISKMLGEQNTATIIRTSIVGEEIHNKLGLLEWAKQHRGGKITGYENHYWNGVTCLELAKIIKDVILKDGYWQGVRHIFTDGHYSKFEVLQIINEVYNLDMTIEKGKGEHFVDRTLSTVWDNADFHVGNLLDQFKALFNFNKTQTD